MGRLNQVEHDSKKKCVYKLEFNSGAEVVKNRSLFNKDGQLLWEVDRQPRGVSEPVSPDAWRPVPFPLRGRGKGARAGRPSVTPPSPHPVSNPPTSLIVFTCFAKMPSLGPCSTTLAADWSYTPGSFHLNLCDQIAYKLKCNSVVPYGDLSRGSQSSFCHLPDL